MRAVETDKGQQIAKLALKLARERGTTVPDVLAEITQDLREIPAGRAYVIVTGVES